MDQTIIKNRITQYLAETGRNATELSEAAGLGKDGVRNILRGASKSPRIDTIAAVAKEMGLTIAELVSERVSSDPTDDRRLTIDGTDYLRVPVFQMRKIDGEPTTHILYRTDWLRQNGIAHDDCVALMQDGDAMMSDQGGIRHGEIVLFVLHPDEIRDGIYWIKLGGEDMIRRLAREPGGTFTIAADNPATPNFTGISANEFQVIGRAKWHGRQVA